MKYQESEKGYAVVFDVELTDFFDIDIEFLNEKIPGSKDTRVKLNIFRLMEIKRQVDDELLRLIINQTTK